MASLHITDNGTNPLITCAPVCLTSVGDRDIPGTVCAVPSSQDQGICSFIAATNIESFYTDWSCNTDGLTATDPCGATIWNNIACSQGYVSLISVKSVGVSGKYLN